MIIYRTLENKIQLYSNQFRAIALMGIRQSGKTTLCKILFPDKPYLNFENIDVQILAEEDPNAFLKKYISTGAILTKFKNRPTCLTISKKFWTMKPSEENMYLLAVAIFY